MLLKLEVYFVMKTQVRVFSTSGPGEIKKMILYTVNSNYWPLFFFKGSHNIPKTGHIVYN